MNRIAVITGGSRGLGRSMALHLAEQGVGVVLTYRGNGGAADEVVHEIESKGGRAVAMQLDTTDAETFTGFAEKLEVSLRQTWGRGSFDYLVNNAGFGYYGAVAETPAADLDALYSVHVRGPFLLTQALLPLMADGGKIAMISSGLARFALPGYGAYAMMKGAVEVLARYLAKELGPRGISVNAIAPGAIETDFGGGAVRDNPEVNQMIASTTAMGRVGLPDDIGGSVAALLAGDTHWMTGQRIEVSGGQLL
ncbi:SDR family NAD(P)-dependent oxidoreductase [Pseudoruegeria sp. HB172150]|uniref:SDR family NAD(P)-dependent oxidoreductase n=1 Tax=Pseudoruegeria sp. HB172150 TaxID=2721164 RepID=UPI001552C330|nr:SDR family oxidoreductase [Pseudoruegeria sp. HB172150]